MLGWVTRSSVIWGLLKKMVNVSPDSVSVYQVPKFSCPRSRCPLLPSSCQSSCREVFFSVPSHGASKIWKLTMQILQQKKKMCFWRKLLKYFYYKNCTSLLQEKNELDSDCWTPYYNQNFSWACLTCLEKKSSLTKHIYIHVLPELVTSACFK